MYKFKINWSPINATGNSLTQFLSRIHLTWAVLYAVVLGMLLGKWFWVFFAPHASYIYTAPVHSSIVETERLFGQVLHTEASPQNMALPNVKLLGVFTASTNMPGFAILELDGSRQVAIVEGEEIFSGTKLITVHADYVLLGHGNTQQKVTLENR